jgi:beta-glucanase (GH16 family)
MHILLATILAAPIHLNSNPNYCLGTASNATSPGTAVQLHTCNGGKSQDWSVGTAAASAAAPSSNPAPAASAPSTQAGVASSLVDPNTPAKSGYHAVFSDEFDGAQLDLTKWNLACDGSGGGNNELQYYLPFPANHFLGNSNLTIRVVKQSFLGQQYTSAKLNTLGSFDFTYGWVEARIKVPRGQGLWPAFWTLPKDNLYGQWPTSGEIDIMEILGGAPNQLYGTAHFGPAWPNQLQLGGQHDLSGVDYSQDFHTFAVDWQTDHIDWYVDGIKYFTVASTDGNWQTGAQGAAPSTAAGGWPFNLPNYVILNMAMGGQWPGAPDASITQADLVVDYVRVYQKN